MSVAPVWSIKLDEGEFFFIHDDNCPPSVQSVCRLSVEGTSIGQALDKGFPIEHLTGLHEKFLAILSNGMDPDVPEHGRRVYCGSCKLVSETPLPFIKFIRSSSRHRE